MHIIGRTAEIAIFEEVLNSNSAEFVAVYGRRRIGKTFLIEQVLKKQIVFQFTGAFNFSMKEQLDNFARSFKKQAKIKKPIEFKSWLHAFEALADYAEKQNKKKSKAVIFIDELPWLDSPRAKFIGALEYLWNSRLSKLNSIVLVVCGSAASWINKKIFKSKGGLHNRVTKKIKLKPFTLSETLTYCTYKKVNLNHYQITQIYMAIGGTPFYLNALKPGKSPVQQINDICFNPNGLLYDEYDNLYYALFKNADLHVKLIELLAKKPQGLSQKEITEGLKIKVGGNVTTALEELEASDFISKHKPIFNQRRNTLYRLIDFYSLFYLKFIANAKKGKENDFSKIAQLNAYKVWCGYAFENICLLHINKIKKALGITGIYSKVSSWKFLGNSDYDGAQVDLVIDRNDGIINLCEIKYYNAEFVVSKAQAKKIRERKATFEALNKSKKSVHNVLISTYGAKKNAWYLEQFDKEVMLEDLFA